mgnify:FL=1
MALDIIILLLVVVVVFQKLWSVLGTKPTETRPISKESAEKIFDILMKENLRHSQKNTVDGGELNAESNSELSETEKALRQIPKFNQESFLNGAKRAFEIIITSFANGDTATLKTLVGKNLVKKFDEIIKQRKADGISAETDFVGFNSAEIINAKIDNKSNAQIAVRFVSEQANVLKDAKGNVIEGDENFIQSITDVWTFERSINATSPNWLLVSTKK